VYRFPHLSPSLPLSLALLPHLCDVRRTELSSEALGATIVDVSDEFFVTADHLLRVPVRLPSHSSAFLASFSAQINTDDV
jgi:hypothetical protein